MSKQLEDNIMVRDKNLTPVVTFVLFWLFIFVPGTTGLKTQDHSSLLIVLLCKFSVKITVLLKSIIFHLSLTSSHYLSPDGHQHCRFLFKVKM